MHLSAVPQDFPLRAAKHLNCSFPISSSFQLSGSVLIYVFHTFTSWGVAFFLKKISFLRTEKKWMLLRLFFLFFLDLEFIFIQVLKGSCEYN